MSIKQKTNQPLFVAHFQLHQTHKQTSVGQQKKGNLWVFLRAITFLFSLMGVVVFDWLITRVGQVLLIQSEGRFLSCSLVVFLAVMSSLATGSFIFPCCFDSPAAAVLHAMDAPVC